MKRLDDYWDSLNGISLALLPLSWLFAVLVWLRGRAYSMGLLKVHRLSVPVIVVGNITVGGTGKTPLVVWLVQWLCRKGMRPGVISRGYGGNSGEGPRQVDATSLASEVGDEPLLIARRTGCPVYVCSDRVAAARALLQQSECDIIISDDGMQHYALGRDIEIAVIDGSRRFGNGLSLPAGPLRERPVRLKTVDLVVVNGEAMAGESGMAIRPGAVINLSDNDRSCRLEDFAGQTVHAVAGIGNPSRFFAMLRQQGLEVREHAFSDHHRFSAEDLSLDDELPILMTEKDAVKCVDFAQPRHWYVQAEAELDESFAQDLDTLLRGVVSG